MQTALRGAKRQSLKWERCVHCSTSMTAFFATLSLLAPVATAQAPPAPPAVAGDTLTTAASGATAANAATSVTLASPGKVGMFSSLVMHLKASKAKLHASPLGKLMCNALKPLSALTGGVVPAAHPPSPADMAKPGAAGTAAKIKADQFFAKERRAYVRYLGTADCHWYPDVIPSLIGALRADRSECVRFEAALALGNGCCCNKATIEALTICTTGSEKDGNPGERSLRVRTAAYVALQNCLANHPPPPPTPGEFPATPQPSLEPIPLELPPPGEPSPPANETVRAGVQRNDPHVKLTAYYEQLPRKSQRAVILDAQRALASLKPLAAPASPAPRTGQRSLWALWRRSKEISEPEPPAAAAVAQTPRRAATPTPATPPTAARAANFYPPRPMSAPAQFQPAAATSALRSPPWRSSR